MSVFALGASPRRGGNSDSLLDIAVRELESAGHAVTRYQLADHQVAPCLAHDDCHACPIEDDFAELATAAMDASAVLFALPVYYWGVPAQLKAFIDRHIHYYRGRKYSARAIGLIIVAGGDGLDEAEAQMTNFLCKGAHAALPRDQIQVLSAYASEVGDAIADPVLRAKAHKFGQSLAAQLAAGGDAD